MDGLKVINRLCSKEENSFITYNLENDDIYTVMINLKEEINNYFSSLRHFQPFIKLIRFSKYMDCIYND